MPNLVGRYCRLLAVVVSVAVSVVACAGEGVTGPDPRALRSEPPSATRLQVTPSSPSDSAATDAPTSQNADASADRRSRGGYTVFW